MPSISVTPFNPFRVKIEAQHDLGPHVRVTGNVLPLIYYRFPLQENGSLLGQEWPP